MVLTFKKSKNYWILIRIKEVDIKFGFGLYFLGKAQKERDTDLSGLLQSLAKNPVADTVDLMYLSAVVEAELDGVKLQLTKREFLDYLESIEDFKNTEGIIAQWSKGLMETIKGNFLPDEPNEDVAEKEDDVKKK